MVLTSSGFVANFLANYFPRQCQLFFVPKPLLRMPSWQREEPPRIPSSSLYYFFFVFIMTFIRFYFYRSLFCILFTSLPVQCIMVEKPLKSVSQSNLRLFVVLLVTLFNFNVPFHPLYTQRNCFFFNTKSSPYYYDFIPF